MKTKFTVFDESGRIITTTAPDQWSGGEPSLVRKAKLYVDTGERMVFTYLEGKTSLLRGGRRVENLYFQYNAAPDNSPVEGLVQFIEALQQGDAQSLSTGTSNLEGITEAEVLDYDWQIQQSMGRDKKRLLWQVAQAVPELPATSSLFQDVIKELVMDGTQLRLGMEDYASTAQAFKYFINLPRDLTVAVPDQGNEPVGADIILFPGAEENYDAEDAATKRAIKKEWDRVLSSYTGDKLEQLENKVATLEQGSDSLPDLHYDLIQLRKSVEKSRSHLSQFRSSKAADAYELYTETQQETEVPDSFQREITTDFLEYLNERIDEAQTQIVAAKKSTLEESLEKIKQFQFKKYEKYVTFKKLKEIINRRIPS
ncbi:hypothetical protein ACODNH_19895 (plasmid) [Haloarcula sp. NS06]|uniref:hypothetical protein n=1 Tax=Haloarcula sp. NS06 TaxID=3409688 RepID=UPI003DA73397